MNLNWISITCLGILLFFTTLGRSQEFYVATLTNELILVDASGGNCSETFIGNLNITPAGVFLTDICFHPDGFIYGVSGFNEIYQVDPANAAVTNLGNPGLTGGCNAMVADADGNVYIANFIGGIFQVDVVNGTSTFLGFCGFGSAGDLTFIDGNLYLVTPGNEIVLIDLNDVTNSTVVLTLPTASQIWGIVSFVNDCDDIVSFATSSDPNSEIYEFNLEGDFNFVCTVSGQVGGAAGENEYIASECDIAIDLDDDDSSGATDADFDAPDICADLMSPIADLDVVVTSDNPVDTIIVTIISGDSDAPNEVLTANGTGDISVQGSGTLQLLLINNGGADVTDFEDLLTNVVYENSASPPTPGMREISVQAFSDGTPSNIAIATIEIVEPPFAGMDMMLSVCIDNPPFDLFELLGPGVDSGGVWNPEPVSGNNIYDPAQDGSNVFSYTVNSTSDCADAVAEIDIMVGQPPSAGNNSSAILCANEAPVDLFTLIAGDPDFGGTFLPETTEGGGIFDPLVDVAGVYLYMVPGADGCDGDTSRLTIILEEPPNPGSDTEIFLCEGQELVDLLDFLPGADGGGVIVPPLNSGSTIFDPAIDPPGFYTYELPSGVVCDGNFSTIEITLEVPPFAGDDIQLQFCTNDPAIDLLAFLNTNDITGTISPALNSGSTLFNPAFDTTGLYGYILAPTALCPGDTSLIDVTVEEAPNAGSDTSIQLCASSSPIDLFALLGNADAGGGWSPDLQGGVGIFDPMLDDEGLYTYAVSSSANCPIDVAFVDIILVPAFDAGPDITVTFCEGSEIIDLSDLNQGNQPGLLDPPLSGRGLIFNTADDSSGTYQFIIESEDGCPGDTAQWTIALEPKPYAGIDTSISFCSNDAPINLRELIGSNESGTFTPSLNADSIYTPGIDKSGTYLYIVGGLECNPDTAVVSIMEAENPDAGRDITLSICSAAPAFDVIEQIGDGRDTSGVFIPGFNSGGRLFDPGLDTEGIYLYIVAGILPCENDTAQIEINLESIANAGRDTTLDFCVSGEAINLFSTIPGSPNAGGSWFPTLSSGGDIFDPSVDTAGTYRYIVDPGGVCGQDTSEHAINISVPLEAGRDTTVILCASDNPISLLDLVNPTADFGGTLLPATATPGIYDPQFDPAGSYYYILPAVGNCPGDSASLQIELEPTINLGPDTVIRLCSDQRLTIDLLDAGGVAPAVEGFWNPETTALGIWDAELDAPGTFTFTTKTLVCNPQVVRVVIEVFDEPNAGSDTTIEICEQDPPVALITLITEADAGGTWVPETAIPGFFDPAIDAPGTYLYIVETMSPCPPDTATVSLDVLPAIDPGVDTSLEICLSTATVIVDLRQTAQIPNNVSGSWSPELTNPGIFVPGLDVSGIYTFTANDIPCLTDRTVSIEIDVLIPVDAGSDTLLTRCPYDQVLDLNALLPDNIATNGSWFPSEIFNPAEGRDGRFEYVLENNCGADTALYEIQLLDVPVADIDPFDELCPGDSIEVRLPELQGITYSWSDGFTGPVRDITAAGEYGVTADNGNCMSTAFIVVSEPPDCGACNVYVPNAFSPNGDGVNDLFQAYFDCEVSFFGLSIYNRWGGKVFETEDVNRFWDGSLSGKRSDEAVYAYVLRYIVADDPSQELRMRVGDVTLIR